jgi:hypothetical protein
VIWDVDISQRRRGSRSSDGLQTDIPKPPSPFRLTIADYAGGSQLRCSEISDSVVQSAQILPMDRKLTSPIPISNSFSQSTIYFTIKPKSLGDTRRTSASWPDTSRSGNGQETAIPTPYLQFVCRKVDLYSSKSYKSWGCQFPST